MSTLDTWAAVHGVSAAALDDLRRRLTQTPAVTDDIGEAGAMSRVRLEAARAGVHLWRNNVGAGRLDSGSYLRWGLANESYKTNAVLKSSDLIGLRPVLVTPAHVGTTIGQFVAREVKAPAWHYGGSAREIAQRNFLELVAANGGDAAFTKGVWRET